MLFRLLILLIVLFSFSFCKYEKVKIGYIDTFYANKVSYEELREIIDDIEFVFEDSLGMNVFDYSKSDGKVIDIVYMPASKLERRIKAKIDRLRNKERKIKKIEESFYEKQEEIDILKSELTYESDILNSKVREFNEYVKGLNTQKNLTREEYNQLKKSVNTKKKKLDKEIKTVKAQQRVLQRKINSFNQKVHSYNFHTKEYNRLNNEVEAMSRSFKKVKGKAFGNVKTTIKTFYKNGKKVQEKNVESSMDKIEIYGFDTLEELKAVLAHEIAHLVGLPHIDSKGSLMNPILQKNQIKKLELTQEDMVLFKKYF